MSKKPLKKSDLNKGWMNRARTSEVRLAPEYHLIISEGTDTEPLYFGAMRDVVNARFHRRISLEVIGIGANTLSLFQKALNRAKKLSSSGTPYKHVWVVYDKDDFPAEHFDRTAELCEEYNNSETTYHAIWSNQCIELWFLLHFSFMQSDLHRSEYWPKLTEQLETISCGSYRKNRPDMYRILRPLLDDAIRNAEYLDELNKGKLPSSSAPGTKVYLLVEMLREYL